MRLWSPALALLIAAGALAADRRKPDIDPESQDGILLQRILQEPTLPRKQALLEKFVEQFPKATSIAWVYTQLLPIYLETEKFDNSLATAEQLLELDPLDLDAAHGALRSAEAKKDADLIAKYAQLSWDLASKVAQTAKPGDSADADDVAEWVKQVAFARDVMTYSEFMLYSQAKESTDAEKKSQLVEALESRNPQSKYLQSAKDELIAAVEQGGSPEERLAFAEKKLEKEPENEDMLMVVAQYDMQHEREFPRVLRYALKVIDILRRKDQPQDLTPEAWAGKKSQYAGMANWMAGVIYAQDGRWELSERHLREALPNVHETGMLAAAYYYLGYDNYALASEQHDKAHLQDSLRYSKLCAGMEGPFRAPAQKNLEVLKSEFNVE